MYVNHPSSQHIPLYVFLVFYTVAMKSLIAGLTAVALSSELPASRTVGVPLSTEQQVCQGIPRPGDWRRATRVEEKSNVASAEGNIEGYNQTENI